jgi:hypothetical protein
MIRTNVVVNRIKSLTNSIQERYCSPKELEIGQTDLRKAGPGDYGLTRSGKFRVGFTGRYYYASLKASLPAGTYPSAYIVSAPLNLLVGGPVFTFSFPSTWGDWAAIVQHAGQRQAQPIESRADFADLGLR